MASTIRKPASPAAGALRLRLCCQFAREPIQFRTTTATALLRFTRTQRLARIAELCLGNAEAKAKELAVARLLADLKGKA